MFLLHIIKHLYKIIAMFAHPKISLKQTYFSWMRVASKTEVKLCHDV